MEASPAQEGCDGEFEGVNSQEDAESAAAALQAAISRRGGQAVLEELVCGASDADLALAVAAALAVGPRRNGGDLDEQDRMNFLPLGARRSRVITHLLERRDILTCTRIARRLGMELELARSPMFLRRMVDQRLFQLMQQMGDHTTQTKPLILDTLLSCGSNPDLVNPRHLCWGALSKLATRWPDQCSDAERRCWEERFVLEELLSSRKIDEALEYAGDDLELRSVVSARLAVDEGLEGPDAESINEPKPDQHEGSSEHLRDVQIVWVRSACAVRAVRAELELLRDEACHPGGTVVGLDCEWRHPRPVSLMQIAVSDKVRLRGGSDSVRGLVRGSYHSSNCVNLTHGNNGSWLVPAGITHLAVTPNRSGCWISSLLPMICLSAQRGKS